MTKLFLWFKATRTPFFTASFIPVLVGNAVAFSDGSFYLWRFIVTLLGVTAVHAGANLLNDYYDCITGCDEINSEYTIFNGGSRCLQDGLFKTRDYMFAAIISYSLGLIAAIYLLIVIRNWMLIIPAFFGLLAGIFYSYPRFYLMGKGWGEIIIWLTFGPAVVSGAYMVQTGHITLTALLAGVPIGFLIMGILYLNQFPDAKADLLVGKKNWVVRLGRNTIAVMVFFLIISACYLSIVFGLLNKSFPPAVVIAFLSLPLAFWVCHKTWQCYNVTSKLLPAMGGNIFLHFVTGLLIAVGFLIK